MKDIFEERIEENIQRVKVNSFRSDDHLEGETETTSDINI